MKRLLLIFIIGLWGCEDNGTNNTVHELPTEFPLDRDYAWEYARIFYSNKTLWESELQPDTTYLDTLFVVQTENDHSYYWWGNNPSRFSLVKNKNDVNHFIRTNYYYIEEDSTTDWDKPNLWSNYTSNFDTTGYNAIYYSFFHNRATAIDTIADTITYSYLESTNKFFDDYEYFVEKKSNLFGSESWKYYYDWFDDDAFDDVFGMVKKQREINISSTSMVQILSGLENKIKRANKFRDSRKIHERDLQDKFYDDEIW